MGIKINPQKTVRMSKQLTDCLPEYVSVVGAGANQQGFRVVKNEEGKSFFSILDVQEAISKGADYKTKVSNASSGVNDSYEIIKILFDKNNYSTMKDVEAYLNSNGFDSSTINLAEQSSNFVAKAVDVEDENSFSRSGNVTLENGITVMIGKKESKSIGEVLTGDIVPTKKYDWVESMMNGGSVKDRLSAGLSDGIPFGFPEATDAFVTVMMDAIKKGDMESLSEIFNDYKGVLDTLKGCMDSFSSGTKKSIDNKETHMLSVFTNYKFSKNMSEANKNVDLPVDATIATPEVVTPAVDEAATIVTPTVEGTIETPTDPVVTVEEPVAPEANIDKEEEFKSIIKESIKFSLDELSKTLTDSFKSMVLESSKQQEDVIKNLTTKIDELSNAQKKTEENLSTVKSIKGFRNGSEGYDVESTTSKKSKVSPAEKTAVDYQRYLETKEKGFNF